MSQFIQKFYPTGSGNWQWQPTVLNASKLFWNVEWRFCSSSDLIYLKNETAAYIKSKRICTYIYYYLHLSNVFCLIQISLGLHILNKNLVSCIIMRLFCPLNSLVVIRNLWLILWSKIWSFSNLVKQIFKNSEILRIPNLCLFFL